MKKYEAFEAEKNQTLLRLAICACNDRDYDTTRDLLGVLFDRVIAQIERLNKSEVA